jgi:hypothetical protein
MICPSDMRDLIEVTWGEFYTALRMSPDENAEKECYALPETAIPSMGWINENYNTNQKTTLLADLLVPFFLPYVSYDDIFQIARAGESSAHMFHLFQERPSIVTVLSRCKRIKSERLSTIFYEGPLTVLDIIEVLFAKNSTPASEHDIVENQKLLNNFSSCFDHTTASAEVKHLTEAWRLSDSAKMAGCNIYSIVQSSPAWSMLRPSLVWARRHDDTAVRLKNISLPGSEARQRKAAELMKEAIAVFDEMGAPNDAAIARSNLANLLSGAVWLTLDQRAKQAGALYDAALVGVVEPRFKALLKDNIAGHLGRAINMGLPVPSRKGVDLAKQAAVELELLGETERLPLVLANVATHLLQLQNDTVSRVLDLREARQFAARALELLLAKGSNADERQTRHIQHLLADITLRLSDYDRSEAQENSAEAIRLLSMDAIDKEKRAIDLIYTRAKANNLLGNHEDALRDLTTIKDEIAARDHPGFYSEVLQLLLSVKKKLYKPGDPVRRAAADDLARYSKSMEIPETWVEGEWEFLQECLFAAGSREFGQVDLQIERAELVLSQVDAESDNAVKLQLVLGSAYSLRSLRQLSISDLKKAVSIFTEMSARTSPSDLAVLGSNILLSWIQETLHNCKTDIDIDDIKKIMVQASEVSVGLDPDTGDIDPDISALCEATEFVLLFLASDDAIEEGFASGLALRVRSFRERLSTSLRSRNSQWLVPLAALVEAGFLTRGKMFAAADATLRAILREFDLNPSPDVPRGLVLDAIYENLSYFDLAQAIIEMVVQDSRAAAWTYIAETSAGFDPHRLDGNVHETLAQFAEHKIDLAHKAGVLQAKRVGAEFESEAEKEAFTITTAHGSLPEIDNLEFPISKDQVLREDRTIVILVPGYQGGKAIIVPKGERIRDAFEVILPKYSNHFFESLYISEHAGWSRALLSWHNKMEVPPFDKAIRSTAVKLWDAALGPVSEALGDMESFGGVDLITTGRQRMLPWSCASPSTEMHEIAADLLKISVGVDLGTLILGQARLNAGISRTRPSLMSRTSLMVTAPFLADESERSRVLSDLSGLDFEVISITDGTNDLPLSRVEGDYLRLSFKDKTISFEGGIPYFLAPHIMTLLDRARILHFASHGFWSPTHPWASAILLGPDLPLYAATIRAVLRLQGAILLLSACESGIGGAGVPNEGGVADDGGLVHAFLLAGAQAVVASSWLVHDLCSAIFMKKMFSELASGTDVLTGMSRARHYVRSLNVTDLAQFVDRAAQARPNISEALHRSAVELVNAEAHPFNSPVYWAPQFAASTGDWQC